MLTRKQKTERPRGLARMLVAGSAALGVVGMAGCVQVSGGTWMFRSASTPEGWPEPTPIGEVQVKAYPAYRAAQVNQTDLDQKGTSPMFMTLFRHIQNNDISMTAPVAMGYDDAEAEVPRMNSMAFLYSSPEAGDTVQQDRVEVHDVEGRSYLSVGVRGAYTDEHFAEGKALLQGWLQEQGTEWRVSGPPRYLGYNSPFVPWFWRYGEVQIPVEPNR